MGNWWNRKMGFQLRTNGWQRGVLNQAISSASTVRRSVPKGTILAPLLFLILVNDVGANTKNSSAVSFADARVNMKTCVEGTERLYSAVNSVPVWSWNWTNLLLRKKRKKEKRSPYHEGERKDLRLMSHERWQHSNRCLLKEDGRLGFATIQEKGQKRWNLTQST